MPKIQLKKISNAAKESSLIFSHYGEFSSETAFKTQKYFEGAMKCQHACQKQLVLDTYCKHDTDTMELSISGISHTTKYKIYC